MVVHGRGAAANGCDRLLLLAGLALVLSLGTWARLGDRLARGRKRDRRRADCPRRGQIHGQGKTQRQGETENSEQDRPQQRHETTVATVLFRNGKAMVSVRQAPCRTSPQCPCRARRAG